MNLVEGIVRSDVKGGFVEASGARLPLDRPVPAWEGRKVIYGIRPGAFELATDADGIQGHVEVVEPTGDELYAHVIAGSVRLHVAFAGRPALKINDPIGIKPQAGRPHLFDALSGRRLQIG